MIWFNLHQEPDVYVNGEPTYARPPNKIEEYVELGAITRGVPKTRKNDNGDNLKAVDINKKAL